MQGLQEALVKSERLLPRSIYKHLGVVAKQAISNVSAVGSSGSSGPSGARNHRNDRALNTNAENMCRAIIELCLALVETRTVVTSQQSVSRASRTSQHANPLSDRSARPVIPTPDLGERPSTIREKVDIQPGQKFSVQKSSCKNPAGRWRNEARGTALHV
jgi:hypothetical protein